MTVALRNQNGGAGERTFAVRLGVQRARQGKRIPPLDAEQQGLALRSSEQCASKRQKRLFAVIVLPHDALLCDAPELLPLADRVDFDRSPPVATSLLSTPPRG
jgi:hypothetical protein